MASEFTGTNTEKIDKLVATIIELRTTLRICFAIISVGFPIIVGLLTFLVAQSLSTTSKVDRLNDQFASGVWPGQSLLAPVGGDAKDRARRLCPGHLTPILYIGPDIDSWHAEART